MALESRDVGEPFMNIWTVYDHPRDFPQEFVARRHYIVRGDDQPRASQDYVTAASLEELRKKLPLGLYCLPRFADDDPTIVEVWL